MNDCRYRDEEIKKKIDEKLTKQKQTEWKLVSRDSRDNNTKKYPNTKQGQNVNNNYLKTSGEYVNNHYSNVLGCKNVYKGSNFINNEETEGGSKITNTKKFNNKENNFPNINNFSNRKFNTINSNTLTSYSNVILKTPTKISTNSNCSSIPIENKEIDIDHYFNAALNVSNQNENITNGKICNAENKLSINQKIIPITPEDIKEFVEEIQKNKDTVSRVESFSCSTEIATPKKLTSTVIHSNTSQAGLLSNGKKLDISKDELKLNITSEELKQDNILNEDKKDLTNSKSTSESKFEEKSDCEFTLDYDLSKIPANFLNANSYSNYFYQTGSNNQKKENDESKLTSYKMEENQIKGGCVNINMNMTMNMNMKMYPGLQGYYNPMFLPNMGIPIFYGMDPRMDPRMGYPHYGLYPQHFGAFPAYPINNNQTCQTKEQKKI